MAIVHRDLIITLAARHKLPAIYFQHFFVNAGGLLAYASFVCADHVAIFVKSALGHRIASLILRH
jgi:hypothetical protein